MDLRDDFSICFCTFSIEQNYCYTYIGTYIIEQTGTSVVNSMSVGGGDVM